MIIIIFWVLARKPIKKGILSSSIVHESTVFLNHITLYIATMFTLNMNSVKQPQPL